MSFRATPSAAPFDGVRAADPPGGLADIRCALDATVQPDGSVAGGDVAVRGPRPAPHPSVEERSFPRPGVWTCVARAAAEGLDDEFSRALFGGSWSAPITFDVRSDFRRKSGRLDRGARAARASPSRRSPPPRPPAAEATITLYRVTGCRDRDFRLRRTRASAGPSARAACASRSGARAKPGYYIGRFGFGGTRFLRAERDPAPMFLVGPKRRSASRGRFARCPGSCRARRLLRRADRAAALRGQDRARRRRARGARRAGLRGRADRRSASACWPRWCARAPASSAGGR